MIVGLIPLGATATAHNDDDRQGGYDPPNP